LLGIENIYLTTIYLLRLLNRDEGKNKDSSYAICATTLPVASPPCNMAIMQKPIYEMRIYRSKVHRNQRLQLGTKHLIRLQVRNADLLV